MSEILLGNQSMKTDYLNSLCGIETNAIHTINYSKTSTFLAFLFLIFYGG